MTQLITIDEIREYHLKRLYDLSVKSLGQIPQLEDPTEEQKQWIKCKKSWNTAIEHRPWSFRWHYFVLGDYE